MAAQQDVLGLIDARRQTGRAAMVWMEFLHQDAVRPRNLLGAGALRQAQNLVSLLLGHRPPAAAPAPRLPVSLCCLTPTGEPAVEISL